MSIYKCVTGERIDVLRSGLIRFTPPTACNDPFELRPLLSRFAPPEEQRRRVEKAFDLEWSARLSKYPPTAQQLLNDYLTKVHGRDAAISTGVELVEEIFPRVVVPFLDEFGGQFGILSLTEDPLNPVMWAHYSSNHTGFVIEFDENHPWFHRQRTTNDELRHLRKVQYVDRKPIPMTQISTDLFVQNSVEWSYEKEWRVIEALQGCTQKLGDDVHLFTFPPQCLTGLIFGLRMPLAIAEDLRELVVTDERYQHLKLQRVIDEPLGGLVIVH